MTKTPIAPAPTSSENKDGDAATERLQLKRPRVIVGEDNNVIGFLPPQKLKPVSQSKGADTDSSDSELETDADDVLTPSGATPGEAKSGRGRGRSSSKSALTDLDLRIKEIQKKNAADQEMLAKLLGREPPQLQQHVIGPKTKSDVNSSNATGQLYRCSVCQDDFLSHPGLQNHMRSMHRYEKYAAVSAESVNIKHEVQPAAEDANQSEISDAIAAGQVELTETQAAVAVVAQETQGELMQEVNFDGNDSELTLIQFENENGELQYAHIRTEELQQSGFIQFSEDQNQTHFVIETQSEVEQQHSQYEQPEQQYEQPEQYEQSEQYEQLQQQPPDVQ